MAFDKVINSAQLDDAMSYTANRIRAKTGGTDQIMWDSAKGFGDAVDAISSGGGNYNLQTKSVTPTKEQQSISPDQGYYGLSAVTVGAIPAKYQDVSGVTAAAEDVVEGKKIVAADGLVVEGTMADNGTLTGTIDGLTTTSYTIPAGKTLGGTVSLTNAIETALAAI